MKFQLQGPLLFKLFLILISSLLTMSPISVSAGYYGGHGYGHYYPHYRYHHYYPYRYHRRHYRSYHGHYGVSAHVGGDAAYLLLGILGGALLYHIFTDNKYEDRNRNRDYSYNKPVVYEAPVKKKQLTISKSKSVQSFNYKDSEGWDWLAKGNSEYAIDIFAIQSQQNLNSGVPKIGFAIAAANNGEIDRATRSIRKAIKHDPMALNKLPIDNSHRNAIANLAITKQLNQNEIDDSFMLAVLSYMQNNYETAEAYILDSDQSISANNLRHLISAKAN